MSTFDVLESSVESSRPIELYEFQVGSTVYRYSSSEDRITIGALVYEPESIARTRIEMSGDQDTRTLNIFVPSANVFAARYVSTVPGEKATVRCLRYQRDESPAFATTVLLFDGVVQSVRFPNDGHSAEIAVRSIESALNRNIPRFSYTGMCNHFLYDSGCGANPSNFDFIGTVSAVSGNVITVTGAGAAGFDYSAGYARPVGENDFRLVLSASGDDITLLLPFASNVLGSSVQLFAGCDHLVEGDCALVFDRVAEFGGFPFVPNRNPFDTGLD